MTDLPKGLHSTALYLCQPGKGILAADESTGTIGRRLIAHNLSNDPGTRRAWREILLCAPGNEQALSGAILFHETFYSKASSGEPFPKILLQKGILPGIKVDLGLQPLEGSERETCTLGLDGLKTRCGAYRHDGARFCKWRAALRIHPQQGLPSERALQINAKQLAEYAKVAQQCDLVPIVEPEILIDGAHTQDISAQVACRVIKQVFQALREEEVDLRGILLKPMMILPGIESTQKVTAEQVAKVTMEVMKEVVPKQVPGIMFLSGGMSEEEATRNLNELNTMETEWEMSFSFGRALQNSAMTVWGGKDENKEEAMKVAAALAKVNGMARSGCWNGLHPSLGGSSLYEGFRGWRSGEDPGGV